MSVPRIFKDPEHQKLFEKQGFVVVPLLNEDELRHMDHMFDELHPNLPESGFIAGSYSGDFEYKKRVSEEIKVVFKRAYDELFIDYETFGGAYLYKMPTPDSDLFIHQDWTVVDESKHVAMNVWVPLCDITPDNGPLMVLPGSQYSAFPVLRAPTMRYFFDHDYQTAMDQLIPMIVKAGTAVVLSQSLVHYSPPNNSDKIRKAITSGVKTKGAQMIFHYKDNERQDDLIEKFEMDDDFFIHFENFFEDIYKRPTVGKSIGMIEYKVPMLKGDELASVLRRMKEDAGYEFIERAAPEPVSEVQDVQQQNEWKDPRTFWEKYTPGNIYREIVHRVSKN